MPPASCAALFSWNVSLRLPASFPFRPGLHGYSSLGYPSSELFLLLVIPPLGYPFSWLSRLISFLLLIVSYLQTFDPSWSGVFLVWFPSLDRVMRLCVPGASPLRSPNPAPACPYGIVSLNIYCLRHLFVYSSSNLLPASVFPVLDVPCPYPSTCHATSCQCFLPVVVHLLMLSLYLASISGFFVSPTSSCVSHLFMCLPPLDVSPTP